MNRREHLLGHVSEECAEIAQRASKAQRFGEDEAQPGQERTNRERIMDEFWDLVGVLHLLGYVVISGLNEPTTSLMLVNDNAVIEKQANVAKYLAYSRDCGTLTD